MNDLISVIISIYDRPDALGSVLRGLARQSDRNMPRDDNSRRQGFANELADLRAIVRDYRAMKAERDAELRAWRKGVLAHMEKTLCAWERWPASRD